MSNQNNRVPISREGQPRRRRSARHGGEAPAKNPYQPPRPVVQRPAYQPDDDHAPLPMGQSVPLQTSSLPPQRGRPSVYDDRMAPVHPGAADRWEDEDDGDYPRLWPKLLALGLVVVLLISSAVYFLVPDNTQGIMGTLKGGLNTVVDGGAGLLGLKKEEPPRLIKFETPLEQVPTGVKVVFTFAADSPIDGVRIIDHLGSDTKGQLAAVDPQKTVWTLSTVFDQPMQGSVRADMLRDDIWYESDKVIDLVVEDANAATSMEPLQFPSPVPSLAASELVTLAAPDTLSTPPVPTPDIPSGTPFVVTGVTVDPVAISALAPVIVPSPTISDEPLQEDMPLVDSQGSDDLPTDAAVAAANSISPEEEPLPDEPGDSAYELTPDTTQEPVDIAPPAPTPTPMPLLPMTADEAMAPGKLKIADTVYQAGKRISDLSRELPMGMPGPGAYVSYEGGVFTFRNDAFRGNAAFGTADMPLNQLSVLWQTPLGNLRTGDGTLGGLGWTAQPAIVKWSVELRQMMNLNAEKKDVKALKEVIVAAQDGKVYFVDLNDGVPTRDPLDVGYPLKGSVSVDTQGRPLIGFGQGISKMPGKTGPIGYYLYELIKGEELFFLNGRKTKSQNQYSTNGAFDGTALFDRTSDTLVVAGENGLLYTLALGSAFDYLDKFELTVDPVITYLRTKGDQADMSVTNEASVAMYGPYAFTADRQGFIRAVDTNTMLTQWAFDAGDNTDATPALGFDEDGSLGLYTGTTVFTRQKRAASAAIRRLDALSGREVWRFDIDAKYDQNERSGVKASPVVGEHSIADLVIFTVNMTGDGSAATVVALDKQSGREVWRSALAANTISSPVAVYRPNGDAYLIQADEKGTLSLLDARTGELLHALELGGRIEASPAVYNDVLVIGTSGKDGSALYGIRLE